MTRGDKLRQADDIELAGTIMVCVAGFLEQSGIIKEKDMREIIEKNINSVIEWLEEESEE